MRYLIFLFICNGLFAQNSSAVREYYQPIFDGQGQELINSMAGGINRALISDGDLNNDGHNDLLVYEYFQGVSRPMVFINDGITGQVSYRFAPEFTSIFPVGYTYMYLKDYDLDGVADLIYQTPNITNINLLEFRKGYINAQNTVQFIPVSHSINISSGGVITQGRLNIDDKPSFEDVDGDSDIDIVASNFFNYGSTNVLYENRSMELYGHNDSLLFELSDDCWGRTANSNDEYILSNGTDSCALIPNWRPLKLHGSHSYTLFDYDSDGDKDLLFGHSNADSLLFCRNAGTRDTAFVDLATKLFPFNTQVASFARFPIAASIDVNNDGKKDLLVSGYSDGFERKNCVWYYENTGVPQSPSYTYRSNNFLVSTMFDHEASSRPRFFDFDMDGLLDLTISNSSTYSQNQYSQVALYRNTGTRTSPSFSFVSGSFVHSLAQSFPNEDFTQAFHDLDGDGDKEAVLSGSSTNYKNNNGSRNELCFNSTSFPYLPQLYSFTAGSNSPYFFDVDRDGLGDLIIGMSDGKLSYYRNIGTASSFRVNGTTPTSTSLGRIGIARVNGQFPSKAQPIIKSIAGQPYLWVGNSDGKIHLYNDIYDSSGNLNQSFTLASSNFGGIDVGHGASLDVADINNDGYLDYVVGNERGGLNFFTESPLSGLNDEQEVTTDMAMVLSNPSSGQLFVQLKGEVENVAIKVFSSLGQHIATRSASREIEEFDFSEFPSGVYFIEVRNEFNSQILKWMKL